MEYLDYERSSDSSGEEGQRYSDFQNKEFKANLEAQSVRRELRRLRRQVRREEDKYITRYAKIKKIKDPEERQIAFQNYDKGVKLRAMNLYNERHKEKLNVFKTRNFATDGNPVPIDNPFEYKDDMDLDEEIIRAEDPGNGRECNELGFEVCKEERSRCVFYRYSSMHKCTNIPFYVFGAINNNTWTVRPGSYSLLFRALVYRLKHKYRGHGPSIENIHRLFLLEFETLVKAVQEVLESLTLPITHRHFNLLRALGRHLVLCYIKRKRVPLGKSSERTWTREHYPSSFERYEALVKWWFPDVTDQSQLFESLIVTPKEWLPLHLEWNWTVKHGAAFPSTLSDVIEQKHNKGAFLRIQNSTDSVYRIYKSLNNWIALGASGFFCKYNRLFIGRIVNQRRFLYPLVNAPNLDTWLVSLLLAHIPTDATKADMADIVTDKVCTHDVTGDDADGDDADGDDADGDDADGDDADGDDADGDDADGDDADGDDVNKDETERTNGFNAIDKSICKQLIQTCLQICNSKEEASRIQLCDALRHLESHLSRENFFQLLLFLGWIVVFHRLLHSKVQETSLNDAWYVKTYGAASRFVRSVLPTPSNLHRSVFMTLLYMHVGGTQKTTAEEEETSEDDIRLQDEEEETDSDKEMDKDKATTTPKDKAMQEDEDEAWTLLEKLRVQEMNEDEDIEVSEDLIQSYSKYRDLTNLRNALFPQAETQLSNTKLWFIQISDANSVLSRRIDRIMRSLGEKDEAMVNSPVTYRPMNLEQLVKNVTPTTDILFYPYTPSSLETQDIDPFFFPHMPDMTNTKPNLLQKKTVTRRTQATGNIQKILQQRAAVARNRRRLERKKKESDTPV